MYNNNLIYVNIKNTVTTHNFTSLTRESLWSGGSRSRAPPCASGRRERGSVREGHAEEEEQTVTHHQQLHQRVLPQGFGSRLEIRRQNVKGGNPAA